jgi:hypothetical protein
MDPRADIQVRQLFDILLSVRGVVAISLFVMAVVVMLVSVRARWVALSGLLYVATLGRPWNQDEEMALVFPLEPMRVHSRAICVALMLLLTVPALRSWRGWRTRSLLAGTTAYAAFQLIFSAMLVAGGDFTRGFFGAITHLLIFITLGYGASRWLQSWADAVTLVRCVVAAGALFCLGTVWQLVANASAALQQGRLIATAGNAQAAAMVIALTIPPALYLLVRRGEPRRWRVVGGLTAGLLTGMLLWTGSRTGVLMATLGVGLLFRLRAGKLLLSAVIVGAVALAMLESFTESRESLSRFAGAGDTRSHVWRRQIEAFLDNPVVGAKTSEQPGSENSYLNVAARAGIVGLVPLALAMGLVVVAVVRMDRVKAALGEERVLADLVSGSLAALAAGAVFEGYLVGIYSYMVFLIYLYLALTALLLDASLPDGLAAGPLSPVDLRDGYGAGDLRGDGWSLNEPPA